MPPEKQQRGLYVGEGPVSAEDLVNLSRTILDNGVRGMPDPEGISALRERIQYTTRGKGRQVERTGRFLIRPRAKGI